MAGAIFYKGQGYTIGGSSAGGGGGGANVSLLTKAQYDALTPAQKTNGTIYFVYATADPPDAATENAIYYMGYKFSAYDIGGAS
jgi:hypothetical protein